MESKIIITNRLKHEGRWEAASLFKDEKIKELRAAGLHRPEAQTQAWLEMAEKYPPIEIPETPEEEVAEEEYEFTGESGSLKEFFSEVEWVYFNLGTGNKYTVPPPSSGTLPMLCWARKHSSDFYKHLLPKALQELEKKPDTAEEAKQANLAHSKNLWERTHHLLDAPEVDKAIGELRAKKGFAHDDHLGFAGYLKQLAKE